MINSFSIKQQSKQQLRNQYGRVVGATILTAVCNVAAVFIISALAMVLLQQLFFSGGILIYFF